MKTQSQENKLQRLAVPYYGHLTNPRIGLSPIYFVADIDPDGANIRFFEVRVWDSRQEPLLAAWLRKQGVDGLLCSDSQPSCLDELAGEGIWVRANETGDAMEMLERWATLAGEPALSNDGAPIPSRSAA